jgi:TPR repeat protein
MPRRLRRILVASVGERARELYARACELGEKAGCEKAR